MRGYRAVTAVIAATVIVAAGTHFGGQGSGGPQVGGIAVPSANIFVNSVAGVSPSRSASLTAYDSTKAYGTLQTAYAAASCGDIIMVVANLPTRAETNITSSSKTCTSSTPVVIEPLTGSSVTLGTTSVGGINVAVSYVTVTGFTIYGGGAEATSDANFNAGIPSYVTYQNNTIVENMFLKGHHLTITGGSLGGYAACVVPGSGDNDGLSIEATAAGVPSDNVTISGVVFHDINDYTNGASGAHCTGSKHVDCIQAFGADALTITGNKFYNCPTSYALIKPDLSTTIGAVTITNNMGGSNMDGGNGFLVGDASQNCGASTNVNVSYNTFNGQGLQVGCVDSSGTGKIVGNLFVGAVGTCASSVFAGAVSYNVFGAGSNASCTGGSHAATCAPTFQSPTSTTADWHLDSSDTCAKGAGNPADYPATDFDGTTRPLNTVDAGADEIS